MKETNKKEMRKITQAEFMKILNDKTRLHFNKELFTRTDEETINEIRKIICSCERNNSYYMIKVHDFKVVRNYKEIRHILKNHELNRVKSNNQKIISDINERYDSIQMKDSDIFLIVIKYHLRINTLDETTGKYPEKYLEVLIEVPKIVDKYYFRIYGNYYLATYQIVDGSTYNNSSTTSKHPNVTLKTIFMATRIYRYKTNLVTLNEDMQRGSVECLYYDSRIFSKPVPIIKYIMARFGMREAMEMLRIQEITLMSLTDKRTEQYANDNRYYVFKRYMVTIIVPKFLYDNDVPTQSCVYTIYSSIDKHDDYKKLFSRDYWLQSLGKDFSTDTIEKGYEILDSLECIYDLSTKDTIHLPEDQKKDIYDILIWIIREFPNLRGKENMDLSTKRIRLSEYIAAIYALKIAKGIIRIGNLGKGIALSDLEKTMYTNPELLIKKIIKDPLVNYRNDVNDLDSMSALKFTYKGLSGLGDGSSVPTSYRRIDKSYLGRLDMDASSHSDPGMSGTICPLADVKNNCFSDYMEPNEWREEVSELMDEYMKLFGLREIIKFQDMVGIDTNGRAEMIDRTINEVKPLFQPIMFFDTKID